MQPSGRDNNTSTDVLANEECEFGDVKSLLASQHYRKDGSDEGGSENDENGTNAKSFAAELDGIAIAVDRTFVSHCGVCLYKMEGKEKKSPLLSATLWRLEKRRE